MKLCCKCGCPLIEVTLPGEPEERCEHCGDFDALTDKHGAIRRQKYGRTSCRRINAFPASRAKR